MECFRKSAHDSGTENFIQSEISMTEKIHTETITNFLSSFIHRLHEVRNLWEHHTRTRSIVKEKGKAIPVTDRGGQ
jgi:hypothetical protein